MGEKQRSKGGRYVGGFLQLFDWNSKSRKKLFPKSGSPEGSKQGKRKIGNLPTTRHRLIDEDDNGGSSIRGSSDYSCASSVTDGDGIGAKAPGVVARLMGLDTLPTSCITEPDSPSFFDTQSLRDSHSCRISDFQTECQFMYSGNQPPGSEGLCRNPAESGLQKIYNRPIDRFQTEMLPPKLAKSIPLTHHKLLSPIKNPGFIASKNAAHIMEAAAKMIEPGLQPSSRVKIPSVGSSSAPLKVRDLKERMEASQRQPKLTGPSRKPVESNAAKYLKGQSLSKSWNGTEDVPQFRATSGSEESNYVGLKNKGKSVSLAVQAKKNVQKRETLNSSCSRNLQNQKDHHELKSNPTLKSRSNSHRNMQKKSSTQITPGVLRQNNQKQNCQINKDKLPSKASPKLHGRRTALGDDSFNRNRALNKVSGSSRLGSRKTAIEMTNNEKEVSILGTNSYPRKKRSIEGASHYERSGINGNVSEDRDESPFQPNMADSRRKGMDVVSFTFTSPMIKSMPGSPSSIQVVDKTNIISLDSHTDKSATDSRNSKLSSLGLNAIGGDALSVLLERKLRELTYGVESSCQNSGKSSSASILQDLVSTLNAAGTPSRERNKRSNLGPHTNGFGYLDGIKFSSACGEKVTIDHKLQGVEEMGEFSCSSSNSEPKKELKYQYPSPVSVLQPAFSNDSSNSSDFVDNNNTNGNRQYSFFQFQQMVHSTSPKKSASADTEMDLSDSASSTFIVTSDIEHVATVSMQDQTKSNQQEELDYIRELISQAETKFEQFSSGRAPEVINPLLFEQLECGRSFGEAKSSRQSQKVLFDCVRECLDFRCRQYAAGGYGTWAKGMSTLRRKEWLAEDVYKEISGWRSMGDCMMDELVDKDMSSKYGKWLDFDIEEYEVGTEIEKSLVSSLIDEVVADILLV